MSSGCHQNSDHCQPKDTCRESYQQDKELAYLARNCTQEQFWSYKPDVEHLCLFVQLTGSTHI